MKLPDNIKMIFFDFDDTLFVHYSNQRFGNDDEIIKELEKAELRATGSGYQVYDRLGSVNHLMKEFIEEDTKGIPKFCITWVVKVICFHIRSNGLINTIPEKSRLYMEQAYRNRKSTQ